MLKAITNILFPTYCLFCGKPGLLLCNYCQKKLILSLPECYKCRRISANYKTHIGCTKEFTLSSLFWAWQYNSLSSKLIKTLKYKGAFNISNELTDLLTTRLNQTQFLYYLKDPILVPIPMHKIKKKERGFNQSLLIGEDLSKKLNIPIDTNILFRKINSKPQAEKGRISRTYLAENTFFFDTNRYTRRYKKQEIILIDDVVTTGSTLDTASKDIKEENEEITISAICLFRGKPNYSLDFPKS